MRRQFIFATISILAGCSARYKVNNIAGANTARLDRQKGLYIVVPEDGAYGTKQYPGSGQTVAQAIAAAFSSRASRVHIAERAKLANQEALDFARKLDAGYLVVPVIAHWEHRATEWSGRPSVMTIRVTILETSGGQQVSSTSIEGRSRIISWTTTSPESLLRDPLSKYVDSLY